MSFLERLSLSRRVPYQRFHCKGQLSIRDTWFCPILIQYYQNKESFITLLFSSLFLSIFALPCFPISSPSLLTTFFRFLFLPLSPLLLPLSYSSLSPLLSLLSSLSPLLSLPQRDGCHSRSSIRRSAVSSPEPSRNSDSS